MATVIWTPQARADLEAIEDYYLGVAPAYADLIIDGLLTATRRLEAFPTSGRSVLEIEDPAMREVIYRKYRVVYYFDANADRVEVLSVLHTSRQFGGSAQEP